MRDNEANALNETSVIEPKRPLLLRPKDLINYRHQNPGFIASVVFVAPGFTVPFIHPPTSPVWSMLHTSPITGPPYILKSVSESSQAYFGVFQTWIRMNIEMIRRMNKMYARDKSVHDKYGYEERDWAKLPTDKIYVSLLWSRYPS